MSAGTYTDLCAEQVEVLRRRYLEAVAAGLTEEESYAFAISDRDVGELRKLVQGHCPVALIREIVL
jgi:hypothetical protein